MLCGYFWQYQDNQHNNFRSCASIDRPLSLAVDYHACGGDNRPIIPADAFAPLLEVDQLQRANDVLFCAIYLRRYRTAMHMRR